MAKMKETGHIKDWQDVEELELSYTDGKVKLYNFGKKKSWRNLPPGLNPCYKAPIIKTMWYWHIVRCREQQKRIEGPNTDQHIYDQSIFNQHSKKFNGERRVFSTNNAGTIEHPYFFNVS